MKIIALALATLCACASPQEAPPLSAVPESQAQPNVLNGVTFEPSAEPLAYDYFVAGHIYGAPKNKRSIFPAASVLANLERIRVAKPAFFMSLGDALRVPSAIHLAAFRESFLERVEAPVFNAVGNHDVAIRERYLAEFPGPTYYHFRLGRVLHIVVDTELDVGRLTGAQLEWLLALLASAESNESIASVAVYGHKLLAVVGREEFELVSRHLNSHIGYQADSRFNEVLLPALRQLASKKQVTWFAGDIGCAHSLPLFYAREADVDLAWIATGIGDTENDAILRVKVDETGRMRFRVRRCDGYRSPPLETYGVEFWQAHFQKQ